MLYVSLCIMKTILFINIIVGSLIFMGVCLMSLKYFPTSKVSDLIRRYVITDDDLEPFN